MTKSVSGLARGLPQAGFAGLQRIVEVAVNGQQSLQDGAIATFDRFDICEAHYALEVNYNMGGWLQERPSNKRRMEATHVQLHRIRFKPSHSCLERGFDGLTENGQAIYRALERRYGFMQKEIL